MPIKFRLILSDGFASFRRDANRGPVEGRARPRAIAAKPVFSSKQFNNRARSLTMGAQAHNGPHAKVMGVPANGRPITAKEGYR